jgi:hypothetical protein
MSTATYTRAHLYACPDGHPGQHGQLLRTIVPDGLDLAPACIACRRSMAPADGPLNGNWRVDDCCTPAGPGGQWVGPPRDPAACTRCFGTRQAVICVICLLPGCPGDHGDTCLACDGTGRLDCAACDGEGHVYNQFSEDEGLCPDLRCVAGRVPCEACGGTGREPARPPGLPGAPSVQSTRPPEEKSDPS